jgi:hypothetical protein
MKRDYNRGFVGVVKKGYILGDIFIHDEENTDRDEEMLWYLG